MFLQRSRKVIALHRGLTSWSSAATNLSRRGAYGSSSVNNWRSFHCTPRLEVVTPVNLADIGEGIVECEVIQWFVAPGARVEQFSPLCEVQSDKASSEISSKYSGVVTRLYYEPGEMARVGKPLVDIDTEDVAEGASTYPAPGSGAGATGEEVGKEREDVLKTTGAVSTGSTDDTPTTFPGRHKDSEPSGPTDTPGNAASTYTAAHGSSQTATPAGGVVGPLKTIWGNSAMNTAGSTLGGSGRNASLATPAVRHLSKTQGVDISLIPGTGKDGRVLKEDVLRFIAAAQRDGPSSDPSSVSSGISVSAFVPTPAPSSHHHAAAVQTETPRPLTPTQTHMFRSMTRSLRIPHFLYADEVDFSELTELRARLNKVLAAQRQQQQQVALGSGGTAVELAAAEKLSYLPFIIKAVSLALYQYPILNARVETNSTNGYEHGSNGENGSSNNGNGKPMLVYRSLHNIGVAMDTPAGLVVPVIKDVGSRTVLGIAAELSRLQKAALAGKLAPADISGGTITVSNIGNIGGTYVSPVIVEKEVAILGIGRMRTVPAFGGENGNELVRKQVCNFSWSADHRVVDGATMARAAEVVRRVVEEPDVMVLHLR